MGQQGDSYGPLLADLLTAKALVWVATVGRDHELTVDAHLFFFDRYRRLADYHRSHGRVRKADHLQRTAERHRQAAGADGPPYAAAMAMPRPRRFVQTHAVSHNRLDGPDEAA
jgi:hypothetical protein